jgi:hypothetical protein
VTKLKFALVLALLGMGVIISVYTELAPAGGGVQAEQPAFAARTDSALGNGVIAQLGTLKWRGLAGPIQFTPDGKYLVAAAGPYRSLAAFFEPATG